MATKATPDTLRRAAESYAANILAHAQEDGIEGLVVMVVLAAPNVPPQYCVNVKREQVPKMLEELQRQVRTENLVLLPGKGRS